MLYRVGNADRRYLLLKANNFHTFCLLTFLTRRIALNITSEFEKQASSNFLVSLGVEEAETSRHSERREPEPITEESIPRNRLAERTGLTKTTDSEVGNDTRVNMGSRGQAGPKGACFNT